MSVRSIAIFTFPPAVSRLDKGSQTDPILVNPAQARFALHAGDQQRFGSCFQVVAAFSGVASGSQGGPTTDLSLPELQAHLHKRIISQSLAEDSQRYGPIPLQFRSPHSRAEHR